MKKKGFTLIELLAVIVILAVIALIATPIIIGIIESSKEKAHMDSAYGILNGAQLYYGNALLDQNKKEKIENIENILGDISYQGEKPTSGEVKVLEDGKVGLSVEYDGKCYHKDYNDRKITKINKNKENCTIDAQPIIIGNLVTLKDNSKWYILADKGDKVRLLKETAVEDNSFMPFTNDYDICINGLLFNMGIESPFYPQEYLSNYCNTKKVAYPYQSENLSDINEVYKSMNEYMNTTYIPTLMESFKNSGMDISNIKIELPNSKEILKALGITGDGSHINPLVEEELKKETDISSLSILAREKYSFVFTPVMNVMFNPEPPKLDTLDNRHNWVQNNIVKISEYNNNYFWLTNSIFYLTDPLFDPSELAIMVDQNLPFTFYPNYLMATASTSQVNHPSIRSAVTVSKNEITHIEKGLHRKEGLDEFVLVANQELILPSNPKKLLIIIPQ